MTLGCGLDLPTEKVLLRDRLDRWLQEVIAPETAEHQGAAPGDHPALHRPCHRPRGTDQATPGHVPAPEAGQSSRGLVPQGVGLVHRVLCGAMGHALRLEMIYRNPVSLVSPPPVTRQEAAAPESTAVRAVLDLAEAAEHYLFAYIHLIAYTGLRCCKAPG